VNITYKITTDVGMQTVEGEICTLSGTFGEKFGVHKDSRASEGDLKCWAVTHIATGFAVAYGPTRESAEFSASERLRVKGEESFRGAIGKAAKRRTEIDQFDSVVADLED
jgi:hypothetical protein